MENVNGKNENGILTIFLSGNINSANANDVEKSIMELLENNENTTVIIDAEELEYVSSAGLRIILRVKKIHEEVKIINAKSAVYEVFEMTGFTEMMTIEKAYRKFSVEGCEVIGEGANGVVYRLDEDTIIKVYRDPDSLPEIKRERELARKAFVLGIPTAIPYDVAKVGEGYGSVFELLNADSFAKLLVTKPENMDKYVELYVDTLKKLHSTEVKPEDMPNKKEEAFKWLNDVKTAITEEQVNKIRKMIEDVPVKMTMLHGDYHIKNIMMQNGEVILIDMDTLSYGHPIFELAQMFNAYVGFGEYDHDVIAKFLDISFETAGEFWKKTLQGYFETDDENVIKSFEDKIKVVAYMKVVRRVINVDKDEQKLQFYKEKLLKALENTDSLVFE